MASARPGQTRPAPTLQWPPAGSRFESRAENRRVSVPFRGNPADFEKERDCAGKPEFLRESPDL